MISTVDRETKKHLMKCVSAVICNPGEAHEDIADILFEMQTLVKQHPYNKTLADVYKLFTNVQTLMQELHWDDCLEYEIASMAERAYALFLSVT
jgi:hypothetical protein